MLALDENGSLLVDRKQAFETPMEDHDLAAKLLQDHFTASGFGIGVSPTGRFARTPLHLSDYTVAYFGDAKVPVAIALVALGSFLIALRDRQ